jgi:hypothetical protein
MSIVETRVCDQCSALFDEKTLSWMTLTFPNYTPQTEQPGGLMEYDFCTYQCLEAWVNEDDDEDEPETEPEPVMPEFVQVGANTPVRVQPGMTLAEALAMGLKPDAPQ